ncbi:TVP38/TMEM64 family protein [Insulibacter thermoxylanivorax]|uniref:TVP38/TMEM64 family membrane protein n=1 Tax=Insulibacter thermoxylanivorax TaxID=2749268 RepID=A0A916QAC3_9BACL|nr:TVP38/TMEM64 family protein [Insulibacter thermoxylanivorax]GFR37090.1 TVP38/TMEM64 family protein [Insulibacter thermoxylanivorax]
MDWIQRLKDLTVDDIIEWIEYMGTFGPLPGILVTMAEALLPFLPLIVLLVANATAYGMWQGFFLSWIGTTLGAAIVFLFFRLFGARFSSYLQRRYPKAKVMFRWLEHRGFTPLLIAYSLPFTPSALVNIMSGLSTIPIRMYMVALSLGKAFLVFTITLVGHDLASILRLPMKIVLIIVMFIILWLLGKKWEQRYNREEPKED